MVHGFLRGRDGTFITFDPPGSTSTVPASINPEGAITGAHTDANNVIHGFLRTRDGTLRMLDVPGATFTAPNSINPEGTI